MFQSAVRRLGRQLSIRSSRRLSPTASSLPLLRHYSSTHPSKAGSEFIFSRLGESSKIAPIIAKVSASLISLGLVIFTLCFCVVVLYTFTMNGTDLNFCSRDSNIISYNKNVGMDMSVLDEDVIHYFNSLIPILVDKFRGKKYVSSWRMYAKTTLVLQQGRGR